MKNFSFQIYNYIFKYNLSLVKIWQFKSSNLNVNGCKR